MDDIELMQLEDEIADIIEVKQAVPEGAAAAFPNPIALLHNDTVMALLRPTLDALAAFAKAHNKVLTDAVKDFLPAQLDRIAADLLRDFADKIDTITVPA